MRMGRPSLPSVQAARPAISKTVGPIVRIFAIMFGGKTATARVGMSEPKSRLFPVSNWSEAPVLRRRSLPRLSRVA